jgi:hypothetical protein
VIPAKFELARRPVAFRADPAGITLGSGRAKVPAVLEVRATRQSDRYLPAASARQ